MSAGPITEAAEEKIAADAAVELGFFDKLEIGSVFFPLAEALLRHRLEAPRTMCRLDPARLLCLAFASSTVTEFPAFVSCNAVVRPVNPAPIIVTSVSLSLKSGA